ncbi:MAG: ArsA family ATPase [Candidatus Palauibacterales bacterium]|nr:ArsA family ATPase [Candidatus Palauibacterales bacterium]
MTSLLDEVSDREILFAGGKGGVGKTTTAAALALRLAGAASDETGAETGDETGAGGERVLLVSTDPAHSLGDLFGVEIGGEETRLAERLWGLELDPEAETERYLRDVKRTMREFVRPEMYDEIDRQMEMTRRSPGAVEAATLDRMSEVLVEGREAYDRLIFDTAPTGHTLRLLSLPEVMTAWMDGLLESRDRSESFGEILKGTDWEGGDELAYIDRPEKEGRDDRASRIREVLTRRRRKFARARRLLTDPERCGFLVVVNPDELSVREGEDIRDTLDRLEMPLLAVVVNRVLPEEADGEFLGRRRREEARHLERIAEVFSDVPRVRVPLLATDVRGVDELEDVASWLAGDLPPKRRTT